MTKDYDPSPVAESDKTQEETDDGINSNGGE